MDAMDVARRIIQAVTLLAEAGNTIDGTVKALSFLQTAVNILARISMESVTDLDA